MAIDSDPLAIEVFRPPSLSDELTIAAFRGWLERHRRAFGERHGVGLSASVAYCPLSMFLQAQGFTHVATMFSMVIGERQAVDYSAPPPEWARRFLTAVDQLGGPFTSDASDVIAWQVRVTTTQALAILDQVERTLDLPFSEWLEQARASEAGEERTDGVTTNGR